MAKNYIRDDKGRFSSRGGGGAVGRARVRHASKSAAVQETAARKSPSSEFRVAKGRPRGAAKAAGMTASQTMQSGAAKPTVIRSAREKGIYGAGMVNKFKLGTGRRGPAIIENGNRFYSKPEAVKRGSHPLQAPASGKRTAGLSAAKPRKRR